jgi:GNAT superfamily N-acetyltransferase
MVDDVVIRRALGTDLRDLLDLCAEHAAFERLPHAAHARANALVEALDGDPPCLYAWLACVQDTAVGYASATVDFSTLDRDFYLHMDCLYVRAQWRGQGMGGKLWRCVSAQAAMLGCASIQWQTPTWNEQAARFYRKLGAMEAAKLRYVLPLKVA